MGVNHIVTQGAVAPALARQTGGLGWGVQGGHGPETVLEAGVRCWDQEHVKSLFSLKGRARPPRSRRRESPRPPRLGLLAAGSYRSLSPLGLAPFLGSSSGPSHGLWWTDDPGLTPRGPARSEAQAATQHGCKWHPWSCAEWGDPGAAALPVPTARFGSSAKLGLSQWQGPGALGKGRPGRFHLPGSDCGGKYSFSILELYQWGRGSPRVAWSGGSFRALLNSGLRLHICPQVSAVYLPGSRHCSKCFTYGTWCRFRETVLLLPPVSGQENGDNPSHAVNKWEANRFDSNPGKLAPEPMLNHWAIQPFLPPG